MNGSLSSVRELLAGLKEGIDDVKVAEVVVCPPAIYIPETQSQLVGTPISWGGQDLSAHESGAYTGEIAGAMLRDFDCSYVIIGHSERRTYHGETDAVVAEKFAAARKVGLVPVLCIGETLEDRESGGAKEAVMRQVNAVIDHCGVEMLGEGIIAYEPVWAIGTGKTATPEEAQEMHAYVRGRVAERSTEVAEKVRMLYGGSMKPDNAPELLAKPDIDGGLIGGAALKATDFLGICTVAND
jgi:triosephosphate isomerase